MRHASPIYVHTDASELQKQFPPWPSTPGPEGIWGVQGLLHPDLGEDAATFARQHYFDERLMGVARALLGCSNEDLVLELLNLLVRPSGGRGFELRWHRDDVPADADAAAEVTRLRAPAWHAQWNLALYADDSLVVVPGSHARPRTAAERAADPYAPNLPGQAVVSLAPGDCVFYNNNILHRGVYDATRERLSLHGSVGHRLGGPLRARNVLQHGIGGWVYRCDFGALDAAQRAQAEGMRARLLALGRESGDVGYSHEG